MAVARNGDADVMAEAFYCIHSPGRSIMEASMTNENAQEKSAQQQAQPEKPGQQGAQQQAPAPAAKPAN